MQARDDATTQALLKVAIGAFSLAALVAIASLLGGEFDDSQARVAATALGVSVYAVLAMPGYAALASGSRALLGVATLLASGLGFVLLVLAIWVDDLDYESAWQAWGTVSVFALCLAHATQLSGRRRPSDSETTRAVLAGTLTAVAIVALLSAALINGDDAADGLARALGVFAVLAALGTILLPILRRLAGSPPPPPPPARPSPASGAEPKLRAVPTGTIEDAVAGAERAGLATMLAPTPMADGRRVAAVRSGHALTLLIEQEGAAAQDEMSRLAPPS